MIESLNAKFPKFAQQLGSGVGDPIEVVGESAVESDILQVDTKLGIPLPESYKSFLRCTRTLTLRGGLIRFGPEFPFLQDLPSLSPSQGMLCFADFFLEADGDQLLFD